MFNLLYRTKLSWLLVPKHKNLESLLAGEDMKEEECTALREFHHHTNFIYAEPSNTDKINLAQAYYECELYIIMITTTTTTMTTTTTTTTTVKIISVPS